MYTPMEFPTRHLLLTLLLAPLLAACTTTGGSADRDSAAEGPPPPPPLEQLPEITVEQAPGLAVDTLRQIGAESGGALVLMNGLGTRVLPALSLRRAPYDTFVRAVSEGLLCPYGQVDGYYFIYPQGYEDLLTLSVSGTLPEAYADLRGDFTFGEGTRLYNVLAVLNQTLGTNLVADQSVADAAAGEMVLVDAPLAVAVDALLRGARVAPGSVAVDAFEDYVLLRSLGNVHPTPLLANGDALTKEQKRLLDRKVTALLPAPIQQGAAPQVLSTARPLRLAVRALSRQLGIQVTADAAMDSLPVNNAYFSDITVAGLMEALIRQWLVPDFVYEVRDGAVHLRPRDPARTAPPASQTSQPSPSDPSNP